MTAAAVPLEIDQGEDWTTNIVWTDNYDDPVNVVHPCRMEIRSQQGQVVVQLYTDPNLPEGTVPSMALSSDIGLIQLHIPAEQTASLLPGNYQYDLFVTCDDNGAYVGNQTTRLVYGPVSVNKRTTRM